MDFNGIKLQAIEEWELLRNSPKPVIYVGTATCGRSAGAMDVLKALKAEIKKRKINSLAFCHPHL